MQSRLALTRLSKMIREASTALPRKILGFGERAYNRSIVDISSSGSWVRYSHEDAYWTLWVNSVSGRWSMRYFTCLLPMSTAENPRHCLYRRNEKILRVGQKVTGYTDLGTWEVIWWQTPEISPSLGINHLIWGKEDSNAETQVQ